MPVTRWWCLKSGQGGRASGPKRRKVTSIAMSFASSQTATASPMMSIPSEGLLSRRVQVSAHDGPTDGTRGRRPSPLMGNLGPRGSTTRSAPPLRGAAHGSARGAGLASPCAGPLSCSRRQGRRRRDGAQRDYVLWQRKDYRNRFRALEDRCVKGRYAEPLRSPVIVAQVARWRGRVALGHLAELWHDEHGRGPGERETAENPRQIHPVPAVTLGRVRRW